MTDSQENSRQTKILEGIEGIQLNKRYREFSVSVSLTTQTLVEVMAATTLRTLPPPARRQAQTPTGTNRAGGQKAKITAVLCSQSPPSRCILLRSVSLSLSVITGYHQDAIKLCSHMSNGLGVGAKSGFPGIATKREQRWGANYTGNIYTLIQGGDLGYRGFQSE